MRRKRVRESLEPNAETIKGHWYSGGLEYIGHRKDKEALSMRWNRLREALLETKHLNKETIKGHWYSDIEKTNRLIQ